MASIVTTVPLNSSASSSLGIAVISLDFSSTRRCASTKLLLSAQAETMCTMAFLPGSQVPRSALPSMATTSPAVNLAIDDTQAHEALLQLLRIQRREHPTERVVRGNPARKRQKTLEPLDLGVRVILDLVPSVGPTQDRRDGDQKYLFQQILPRPLYSRIAQLSKVFQGTVHPPISSHLTQLTYSN